MGRIVRMPLLVQDRQDLRDVAKPGGSDLLLATPFEWIDVRSDAEFFDGPVTSRVAVLDFDAESGGIRPGATFLPQGVGKTVSCYDVALPDIDDTDAVIQACESDAFVQVSTFATVMKALQFFEGPDALGRRVTWAFDSPQLLVVPRAGLLANAYYDRESSSLQFFYCPSTAGHMIYTSLSPDIIVHETAHAVLDGVAPDLYHSTRTESIALHEAVADLAAIVLTLLNDMVIFSALQISSAKLDIARALARVAEEFGSEMRRDVGVDCLRVLDNRRTLDPEVTDLSDPYEVSEVMSGAIYQTFIHSASGVGPTDSRGTAADATQGHEREQTGIPYDVDEKRVRGAARSVARLAFRALDYLPPGEASLADYGRAMIAAHMAVHGGKRKEQCWLAHELVVRKVVRDEKELESGGGIVGMELVDADPQRLVDSDEEAERFAERHRDLLCIPGGSGFRVLPRRKRVRVPSGSPKMAPRQDLVFRVAWDEEEEHNLGSQFDARWAYPVGTTLVLDWNTRKVLSVLTTEQGEAQYTDRARTLQGWRTRGLLRTPTEAVGPDAQPLNSTITAVKTGGRMKAQGSARVLCS